MSDLFCDGLGACIGSCPEDAITVEEREHEPHDDKKVMENIVPQGANTIRAHLTHLKEHDAEVEFFRDDRSQKCPSCGARFWNPNADMRCAEWCPYAKECLDYAPENDDGRQGEPGVGRDG